MTEEQLTAPTYGKFSSLDELKCAYDTLEADYQKSTSRVKELEEELNRGKENDRWQKKVKALTEKYPVSAMLGDEITAYVKEHQNLMKEENCLETALLNVLAKRAESYERKPSPKTLSGGSMTILPQEKPKTLRDVRSLAIERLKNQ